MASPAPAAAAPTVSTLPFNGERARTCAVIYSGRWWGSKRSESLQNHLMNLLQPNGCAIFVVTDRTNICHLSSTVHEVSDEQAANAAFEREVQDAFSPYPSQLVHAALLRDAATPDNAEVVWRLGADALRLATSDHLNLSRNAFATQMLQGWHAQFTNVARGEALRRAHGPHDIVVRARLDVLFHSRIDLWEPSLPVSDQQLLALGYAVQINMLPSLNLPGFTRCSEHGRAKELQQQPSEIEPQPACPPGVQWRWHWRDWIYVGTSRGMAALVDAPFSGMVLANATLRCFGLCQEEQNLLQLLARNITLHQLPWRVHPTAHRRCVPSAQHLGSHENSRMQHQSNDPLFAASENAGDDADDAHMTATSLAHLEQLRLPWRHRRNGSLALLEGLPAHPCAGWVEAMSASYVLRFDRSSRADCRRAAGACYVQIPKTGSSSVKEAFRFPQGYGPADAWPSGHPSCNATLVVVRSDPVSRFISAIGTVHQRTRPWCLRSRRFNGSRSLCHKLDKLPAFEEYAITVLEELGDWVSTCAHIPKPPWSWSNSPDLLHLLPQWMFLSVFRGPITLHALPIDELTPDCGAALKHVNTAEGAKTVLDVLPANLTASTTRSIEQFYRLDYELMRALGLRVQSHHGTNDPVMVVD